MALPRYELLVEDFNTPQYGEKMWEDEAVGRWQRGTSSSMVEQERPPSRPSSNHGGDIEMKKYTTSKYGAVTDNHTSATDPTEQEYVDFPSRDSDRELRTIRRQVAIPSAVKPWCVRDVAWLDTKLTRLTAGNHPELAGSTNYTPFPHLSANLATSLGIMDMRPAEPHWEGRDPSSLYKLDTWFIAGAQHILRSRTGASCWFMRFPDIEALESSVRKILESLPRIPASQTSSFLKSTMNTILGLSSSCVSDEEAQERLHAEKHEYLIRCLMICYNMKRLRHWLWREYNREWQRTELGALMLSRAVHEILHEVGRLGGDTVAESLELLKLQPDPLIPVYNRSTFSHDELVQAAVKHYTINPSRDGKGLSYLARTTFHAKGVIFDRWSDDELRSYALPDDEQWRTLKLRRIQPKSADWDYRDDKEIPPMYLPAYHRRMNIARRVEARWASLMAIVKDIPNEYIIARPINGIKVTTDVFNMPLVHDSHLDSIWNSITDRRDRYIFKVPKRLRKSSSLPNLRARLWLDPIPVCRDAESPNLGFPFEQLPSHAPPRLHNGAPPAYPRLEDHPFRPNEFNDTSHYFIVIGWFPGELMEPVEVCLWYTRPEKFLDTLRNGINQLRGWRRFLSLKTVQGFGLYKCSLKDRSHSFVPCSASENAILAHFHTACFQKTLSRDHAESEEWARWATSELNNWQGGNLFYFPLPTESHLSLQLMTKWSRYRLVLASSLPMVLSLVIGLYYMSVSEDTQTAWTVSSYIITAGAFLIAVLAVLTTLQDGGNGLGEAKKRGADAGVGV